MQNRIQKTIEALERIERNADEICVRETVNGVAGTYSLAELPTKLAIHHVCRFIRENLEGTK